MRSIGVVLCLIAVVAVLCFVADVKASERQDCHLELQAEMPNAPTIVGAELSFANMADAVHTNNSGITCNDGNVVNRNALERAGSRRDVWPIQHRAGGAISAISNREVKVEVLNIGV